MLKTTLLLLVALAYLATPASITVLLGSSTINQPTIYGFTIILDSTAILPGLATLTFNASAYTFTNSSAINNCYNTLAPATLYSCYAQSNNAISFRWTAAMSTPLYLSISTLTNPPYADNYVVQLSFAPDSGITFQPEYGSINTLQPDTLTSCSIGMSPNYTNTLSTYSLTLTNKNSIPAGGSLQLTLNGFTPTASTLILSSSSGLVNTAVIPTVSGNVYFLAAFFSSTVPAGTSITFSIASLTTPPTTSSTAFSVTMLTSAKTNYLYKIDQRTCSINNIENYPTASLTFSPSTTMKVGDSSVLLYVDFLAPAAIDFSTDTITVQVGTSSSSQLQIYERSVPVTTNVTGSTGMLASNTSTGISFPTTTTSATIAAGTALRIRSGIFCKSLINSGSKTVTIQFYRSSSSYSYNTATLTVSPNVLTAASVSLLSSLVGTSTTYTFMLTINNPLGIGAAVRITLPSGVSIATGTCSVSAALSVVNALSTNVLCTASSTQSILVSNITSLVISSGTNMNISVSNINNPSTTQTTSSLIYQTYYSLDLTSDPVDDSTGLSLTVTAAPITIPNTHISCTRASATNFIYTSYTLTYTVYTSFTANGYLTLSLPSSMQLSTSATASYTLSTTGATNTSLPISNASSLVKLDFNGLVTSTLPSGTIITIAINSIRNHYSYLSVNMQLISYTSSDFAVEQTAATAITLTNSAPDTSLIATLANSNTLNGQTLTYLISLTSPVALTATDVLTIELQNTNNSNTQLGYSTTTSCTLAGSSTPCTHSNKVLTLTTGTALTASTASTLAISSVVLSRSLNQPGSLYIKTYQTSGGNQYLISSITLVPPVNSNTNLVKTASLTLVDNGISSAQLNTPTEFTLALTTTNALTSSDYIVATIPNEWTNIQSSLVVVSNSSNIGSMAGSLCRETSIFCSNHLSDAHQIRIDDKTGTAFSNTNSVSFTLLNSVFVSPKNWSTSYSPITFTTYTSSNYAIDATSTGTNSTAYFYLSCPSYLTYHCKTCNSTGQCLSCYQLGDGYNTAWAYGSYFFRQSTGECVSACGNNYFNNSNVCQQCTSPCYSCLNASTTTCTSCIAPTVLSSSQCLNSCPNTYYNNSLVCTLCNSPCSSCNSSTYCLSCVNNTYLYQGNCNNDCSAAPNTYPNSNTWTCSPCDVSCSACSTTATNCTSCASTYFMTGTNTCTQNCPSGTAKLNSTTCTCNYTACLTCALTINTCTSCASGTFLKENTCTTSCGNNYYLSNSTCIACSSNCQTCDATGCTACNATASILYNNTCLSSCPTSTTQSGNTCITCPSGCTVCTSTSVCTSCSAIYYLVIYDNLTTSCTRPCPTAYPLLENNICLKTCTPPLVVDTTGTTCVSASTNGTSSSTTTTTLTTQSAKIVPFPFTIALAVLAIVCLASKVALTDTILSASLAAFAGFVEVLAWIVFIAVVVAATSPDNTLARMGAAIVGAALVINLVLNVVAAVFFKRYIWQDQKFAYQFHKLQHKTKCGTCVTYTIIILSVLVSHKIIQLLFSNLFESQYFLYKISMVSKLTPLNYIRYLSLLATVTAIAGAAATNYEVQTQALSSLAFIQSVDLIVVTLIAAIITIWATVRNQQLYQKTLAEKRNQIEEELEHDPIEDDVNQFETQFKSGRKNKYKMSSSQRHDPRQDPLKQKMMKNKNPIGQEFNITNQPLDHQDTDFNRIDLNQTSNPQSYITKVGKRRIKEGIDVEDIGFDEQSGQDLLASRTGGKVSNSHKKRLKDDIQSKLSESQRQQTKCIREVDSIHTNVLAGTTEGQATSQANLKEGKTGNEAKKEQLDLLSSTSEEQLNKLPEDEREKAGQMKEAMTLLTAKKVSVTDYLDYLDIIEEENEDKNSDDYEDKKIDSKMKGRKGKGMRGRSGKKGRTGPLHKSIRKDRSARYQVDPNLMVNHLDNMFDEQAQPQQPDFHTRPRNQSQNIVPGGDDLQQLRFSRMRSNTNQEMGDMVVVSLQSGDNDYEMGMGEQFMRGNALKQNDKEQLPPSNMYATQKIRDSKAKLNKMPTSPLGKTRAGQPKLITQNDDIQYLQSEDNETVKHELLDYNNDISPSHFDQPNMRISNDGASNAPTRPKVYQDNNDKRGGQVLEIKDLQDLEDEFQPRGSQQHYQGGRGSAMHRYQSDRNLDYDDILNQKRKNQKMKQLQQIYLPRQEVPRPHKAKKRLNQSTNSHREQK